MARSPFPLFPILSLTALLAAPLASSAATVAPAGSATAENNWFTAGYGDLGYAFFQDNSGAAPRGGVLAAGSGSVGLVNEGNNSASALTGSEDLENPAGGTFTAGSWHSAARPNGNLYNVAKMTFGTRSPTSARIGILVGASVIQDTGSTSDFPTSVAINGVSQSITPSASGGATSADWYFFDVTDIAENDTLFVQASWVGDIASHRFNPVNGVAIGNVPVTNPITTLSTAASEVSAPYPVDVTFSTDVSGLVASDFTVANGTASDLMPTAGPASAYTVLITPTASGLVTVDLPAGSATDGTSLNLASNSLETFYFAPGSDIATVTLSTTATEPVVAPYTVDIVFSEDVVGLEAADFSVLGGAASDVLPTVGPASVYTVMIIPSVDGNVEVSLPAGAALDTDDNLPNDPSNTLVTLYDAPAEVPNPPTGLTVTSGNNRNILNWDDNTQQGFLEFRIKRAEAMGGPYTQIGTTSSSAFADTTAVNGTTYYYVVTAINEDNLESATSDEAEGEPSPSAEPPNFLFIITDDQDTYTIGAYRNSEPVETPGGIPYAVDTPNIDRLADEGMIFHQARIMGSWIGAVCTASRTCIMTGQNTWTSQGGGSAANTLPGIFNRGVRSGLPDLPYATYRTCKTGNSYGTANREFTIRDDASKRGNTDGNGSEWHADRSLDHLENWRTTHRPNGKPFLMYLGFSHPHDVRNARTTPDLVGRYGCFNTSNPGGISLNPAAPPAPLNLLECTPATYPSHPFDNGHLDVRDEVDVPGVYQFRTEAVIRNEIGRQLACVDWIDRQLGRVFDKLEDPDGDGDTSDSVLENTYIVFTSDHGMAIGRHGLQGKQNLYEHTWRVPYIVRGPGIDPGTRSDALIYLHDTFPTFCDLAGLDLPPTIGADDGQSFRSVLDGPATTHRDSVYGLYSGGDKPGMRAVTNGRFKLIKYDVGNNATQVTQMFDIQENPFELLPEHGVPNIAEDPAYALIRQDLEELLMQQRIENDDPYAFLGDRTLFRFEDGTAGQAAGTLSDRFPFGNNGTALSGTGGSLPVFSTDVPGSTDLVVGEPNTLSLDFERDLQHHVQIPDSRELDFGPNPFTLEAWVKFETMPTGNNIASAQPVAMKKVIGASDSDLDYLFLAAAGNYGNATTFNRLALHLGDTGAGAIMSSLSIPDTNWHHISVALDPVSDTVRFTMDDQVDIQTSTLAGTTNAGPLTIGVHFNSSGSIDSAFDGVLDEVSITDGFLPVNELQALRAVAPATPFEITDFQLSADGSTIDLTFASNETRLYTIQRSTTLAPGSWTDVVSFIPGAAAAGQTAVPGILLDPATTEEFFRVVTVDGL